MKLSNLHGGIQPTATVVEKSMKKEIIETSPFIWENIIDLGNIQILV